MDIHDEKSAGQVQVGSVWHIGCVESRDEHQGHECEVLEASPGFELIDTTATNTSAWTTVKKGRRQKKKCKLMEVIEEGEAEEEENIRYSKTKTTDENVAVDICVVGRQMQITMDSAAEASVCPREWGEEFGLVEVPEKNKPRLVNASGGSIPHHGFRETVFKTQVLSGDRGAEDKLVSMGFEFEVCGRWPRCGRSARRATWSNSVSSMARASSRTRRRATKYS